MRSRPVANTYSPGNGVKISPRPWLKLTDRADATTPSRDAREPADGADAGEDEIEVLGAEQFDRVVGIAFGEKSGPVTLRAPWRARQVVADDVGQVIRIVERFGAVAADTGVVAT